MKRLLILPLALFAVLAGASTRIVQDQCGPFTDVSPLFCPYVLEAYYTGITAGTSPTTFSPDIPITRGQGAVFTTKALNQALARGSRRAALGQWWTTTPHWNIGLGVTPLAGLARGLASDGLDVWVAVGDSVVRVRQSDGGILETWTGASDASCVLVAAGRVFVAAGNEAPGGLYMIDPSQPAGPVTTVSSQIGATPTQIAFDGSRIWTSNYSGSVSIVTPGSTLPWTVATVTTGFTNPNGICFDGTNIWVSDHGFLFRLDMNGSILQTVPIGTWSDTIAFDGTNLYVATGFPDNAVVVVQAATGAVRTSLTGNGIDGPYTAAFDGQRILILSGDSGSVWSAADLRPISSFSIGPSGGVCSDGVNFWIALNPSGLARF